MPVMPDEDSDEQPRERELPGHAEGRPGIGQETKGRPVKSAAELVRLAARAEPRRRGEQRERGDEQRERRRRRASDRRARTRASTRRARPRRRCSPRAAGGCPRAAPRRTAAARARSRRGTAGRSAARRRGRRRAGARAAPTSQCQPASTATSERTPIVAWLKRGARESITAVSRYGSASRGTALAPVRLDQHLRDLGTRELDRRQLAGREHLAHLRPAQEDVILRRVRARLRARHRPARLAPERVLEEHRLDVELVRLELVEDQLRVVRAVVVCRRRRGRGRR